MKRHPSTGARDVSPEFRTFQSNGYCYFPASPKVREEKQFREQEFQRNSSPRCC
jgi:hypothetical protein